MKLNEQVEREFFGMKPYASIDVKCLYPQHGEAMDAYVTMLFPNRQKRCYMTGKAYPFPYKLPCFIRQMTNHFILRILWA